MIAYLNGQWLDEHVAAIPINDRGFLLADGVFETARLVNGKYFRFEQHIERFADSAAQLKLQTPPPDELRDIAGELARKNTLTEGSLRFTLSRGPGGRGLDTRGAGPATFLATIAAMPSDWRQRAARGWHLITADTRRPSPMAVPGQLKALGRVHALLAHLEAETAGADDALLLTAEGYVGEGPTWNFFWRKGSTIRTADLSGGILEGLTRGYVLDIARAHGYATEEGLWPLDDVHAADEAFASMTSVGVVPVRSLDGVALPAFDCAPLLQREYWKIVERATG